MTPSLHVSTPSPRAKRKRPIVNMNVSGGVKQGRTSDSSPVNGAARSVRTTKAAGNFATNSKLVGSRVARDFHGTIHFGTVKKYLSSANSARWAVQYDDGDADDINQRELKRAMELYNRKKSEDVVHVNQHDGWDFGEVDNLSLHVLSPQKPIGLPQIALEETIEFLWEKGLLPFEYSKNMAAVVDDWDEYQIFYWHEGSGGGTAIVSHRSHPEVKVRVKWRLARRRRRRKVSEQGLFVQ